MKPLRMIVCVKATPKPEEIRVDPQTNTLNRLEVRSEINPPDMNAIETALRLKDQWGGRVDLISMGPLFVKNVLQVGLAMGADHLTLLSDRSFGGADTLATTYTLARGIEKMGEYDLIICGEESSDGATGQVPSGLAEWLNLAQITQIDQLEIYPEKRRVRGRRRVKGKNQYWQVPLPALVSIKVASNEPRFMDYTIKKQAFSSGKITVWTRYDLPVEEEWIGLTGSPTRVSGLAQAAVRERKGIHITGSSRQIARELAQIISEKL